MSAIKEQRRRRRQPQQLVFVPYEGTRLVGGFDMGVARPNQRFGQHRNYKGTASCCDTIQEIQTQKCPQSRNSDEDEKANLNIKKVPTRETTVQAVQRYGKLL